VPYAASIEGIISRTKKKDKLNLMRKKNPDQEISESDLFAEVDDILAARNVKVYLRDFNVTLTPF
jgi:hypothetical protein